jgi:hypothetical protein
MDKTDDLLQKLGANDPIPSGMIVLTWDDAQSIATLITSLREALEEWQSAREAFIGMNATGGKEALNRLSEAEDKLSSIARLNPSRKETI